MIRMHDLRPDADVLAAVQRTAGSGVYLGGDEVCKFERAWADYCGAEHCVAVDSGFDALRLILKVLQVEATFLPAFTCIPVWSAVEAANVKRYGVEPEIDGNIETSRLLGRPDCILRVHMFGKIRVSSFDDILLIAATRPIIEDYSHAHGIKVGNNPAVFSFYPTKNLGALGDGGAVVTNDKALADGVRQLAHYSGGFANSRMDEIQAAVLLAKLPHLAEWNDRRRMNAHFYLDVLAGCPGLKLPDPEGHFWHQFVIRHERRDDLKQYLAEREIETQVHYSPAPSKVYGFDCPKANEWARTVLSLPVAPHLEHCQLQRVADEVRRFCENG